jgi:hypothetical protein
MRRFLPLLALLALGSLLAPRAPAAEAAIRATTRAAFEAVAASVRQDMQAGGRYAYVKPDERDRVEAALVRMQALFEHSGSVDAMDAGQKVALFNAQEEVNGVLALRDRDRLVCERGSVPGSRIVSSHCRTYGEIEADREASRRFMQQKLPAPCSGRPCSEH